jgi:hypothetical protein
MKGVSWLDYSIEKNPTGMMNILANNGYNGYLAPQNAKELHEACIDFMGKDDENVVTLLHSHPDFEMIKLILNSSRNKDYVTEEPEEVIIGSSKFTAEDFIALIKQEKKKLIQTTLLVGAIYIGFKILTK